VAGEHWAWLRAGELRVQRCADCGAFRHPPRPRCAICRSDALEWVLVDGRGEVWSHTTIHAPTLPAFADRVPYQAVVVRLDVGVFLVTQARDHVVLEVGARVVLEPVEVEPGLVLALARPDPTTGTSATTI
jgi:uncharacterized OB-fold protein